MKFVTRKLQLFFVPIWIHKIPLTWRPDLIAGLSVAIVAIPQSFALAQLAGLPAYFGLYALFLPTIVAAYTGTSRVVSTGPVAIVSLLTLSTLSEYAEIGSSEYILLVSTLALLVGLIQICLGVLKLGSLIRYVAQPVVSGFVSAAALIILFSQLHILIGLPGGGSSIGEWTMYLMSNLSSIDVETTIIGLWSLVTLVVLKKFFPRLPAILFVVIVSILISMWTGYTGSIVGSIPQGLPQFGIQLGFIGLIPQLLVPALIIAIVAYMGGFSVMKSLSFKTHDKVRPNKEMVSQGLANITAGLSGTMPVGGSVSRTALTYSVGAKTALSSIVVGITALITLLFLSPIFSYLPTATLAAIIIVAVAKLIDIKELYLMCREYPRDGIIAVTTFVATILFAPQIDYGILLGIIVSILVYLHRSANPPYKVFFLGLGHTYDEHDYHFKNHKTNKYVAVVAWDWSISFANSGTFEDVIEQTSHMNADIRYVLVMGRGINYMDSSGKEALAHATQRLRHHKKTLMLSGLKPDVLHDVEKHGLLQQISKKNIFYGANDALIEVLNREKK